MAVYRHVRNPTELAALQHPLKVLLVDDDRGTLLAFEAALQELGQDVVKASSAAEALRYLLVDDFAVIVLDVKMPDMDGFETAALIRGRERSRHTPIIFLTAIQNEESTLRGYLTGAVDYLVKPVAPEVLRSKVAVFCELARKTALVEEQARTLARAEERYRDLFENASDIIYTIDLEGNFTSINRAAERLSGYSRDEALQMNIAQVVAPEYLDLARQIVQNILNGETSPHELAIITRDGRKLFIEVKGRVILEGQEPVGIQGNARDITERKQAHEALRKAHEELEQRVEERTLELLQTNQRLEAEISERKRVEEERERLLERERAARSEAEHANRLKDEFLATISHELRTPLTPILGWARMLRTGELDEPTREQGLEVIERNAKAQARLVEEILDASRLATGKIRLDVHQVDLPAIIQAATESVCPTAKAKGVQLIMLDLEASSVQGDPVRLQELIWSLLSNAIKFTPEGGRVTIGLRRIGSHAEITVSDTGHGIRADFLPHVFEHFRQADSSTTRAHGGLGLGLAIVRHLVESHGGTVHADSPGEGHGATFTVTLPLIPIGYSPQTPARAPECTEPQDESGCGIDCHLALDGVRVLVVDDEADTRGLVASVLERCRAEVTVAASTPEALQALDVFRPDILIADIGMPGEDGYALIRKVREREAQQRNGELIRAIALTAYVRPEDRQRALQAGYQMHLGKPIEPTTLAMAAAKLVGRSDKL